MPKAGGLRLEARLTGPEASPLRVARARVRVRACARVVRRASDVLRGRRQSPLIFANA